MLPKKDTAMPMNRRLPKPPVRSAPNANGTAQNASTSTFSG